MSSAIALKAPMSTSLTASRLFTPSCYGCSSTACAAPLKTKREYSANGLVLALVTAATGRRIHSRSRSLVVPTRGLREGRGDKEGQATEKNTRSDHCEQARVTRLRLISLVSMPGVPALQLSPNVAIPAVGYGVGTAWFKSAGTDKEQSMAAGVTAALEAGFCHIDEAEMYENEQATGVAIEEWLSRTGTPRSDLFITSKVMSVDDPGVTAVCKRSLERMKLEYFDLYLVHAPFQRSGEPFSQSLPEVWKEMESLVDAGLARTIGVSNWRICDLVEIYESATIKPVCNQVEAHPYLQQSNLLKWCTDHGILVSAYGGLIPLTKPATKDGPVEAPVVAAAERHGKTPAQVLMRWSLQCGRGVITTTSKPERLKDALNIFDFELSEEEVSAISEAGSSCPRRIFWTQCKQFPEDPRLAEE